MRKEPYIILLIGFSLFVLATASILHLEQKPVAKPMVKSKVVYRNKIDKVKLASWIYHNSFRCSYKQAEEYTALILKQPYPLLVTSIIKQESHFTQTDVNKANGILVLGLMQIYMTKSHIKQLKDAGIIKTSRDLFNPDTNIKAGVFILKDIIKINKGNLEESLKMYCGKKSGYSREVLETLGQLSLEVK